MTPDPAKQLAEVVLMTTLDGVVSSPTMIILPAPTKDLSVFVAV